MSKETVLFIAIGTLAMILIALFCKKDYGVSLVKALLISVLLTVFGVFSVLLMFFIENGSFGGVSFFGAVFFVPLFLFPLSLLLKIRYPDYLDLSAPMICAMLAIMKLNCLRAGCCAGMILRYEDGAPVRFPSQIVELIVALVICLLLVGAIKGKILRGALYPAFMILYGATRFALNLLRETEEAFFGLAIGNLWALLSTAVGLVWIILYAAVVLTKKRKTKNS